MGLVLASGVFDVLHPGHVYYLQEASKLGDELRVLIARDENVARTLIFREEERKRLVSALKPVDGAFLGHVPANVKQVMQDHRPQVIALGYDQDKERLASALDDLDLDTEVMRIPAFHADKYSTSKFKRRMKQS